MTSSLFDYAASIEARDAGCKIVADNGPDFMALAKAILESLPRGEWTGEQIRARILANGIAPHHPNAWGSLILSAVKRGFLRPTGRYTPMADVRSHGRQTPIYAKA